MNKKIKETEETFLKLKICYPEHNLIQGTIEYRILRHLFKYLTAIISVKTNVGYYLCADSEDLKTIFKIDILDKSESKNINEIVKKRIYDIKNILENFDYENIVKSVKWCIRAIKILNINTNKFLYIKYNSKKYYIKLSIFKKDLWNTHVYDSYDPKTKLKIRQIVDPLISDYGLYVNHSKTFSDFCIRWNILHLYEHLMVPWDIFGDDNILLTNGFTTPTGLCYCFTIMNSLSSLINNYNKFIIFFNKVRKDPSFLKERTKLEERRTLSESIDDKNFSSFGRVDPDFYENGYDINIFQYYANQPLEILLIVPEKINLSKLNKLNSTHIIQKPKTRIFNEPSMSMFRNRMTRTVIIEDMKHKNEKSYNGVDCILNSVIGEDLSEMNNLLSNTFRILSQKDLEKYISCHLIPNDNIGISVIDDYLKKSSFYTFDIKYKTEK